MATAGQSLKTVAGRRILDSEGRKLLSDGSDSCGAEIPELFKCSDGLASGIGLRDEDVPAGFALGDTVEYQGSCYTTRPKESRALIPTAGGVERRPGGCLAAPCFACGLCNDTPSRVTVGFSGVTVCPSLDCQTTGFSGPGFSWKLQVVLAGTYDVPLFRSGPGFCEWRKTFPGAHGETWNRVECQCEHLPSGDPDVGCRHTTYDGITILVQRVYLSGSSPDSYIRVFASVGSFTPGMVNIFSGLAPVPFGDCRQWATVRNEWRGGCVYPALTGGSGGSAVVVLPG